MEDFKDMLHRVERAISEYEKVIRERKALSREMKWRRICILSKHEKRNSHESVSKAFAMSTLMQAIFYKRCLARKNDMLKDGLES
ncbi:unnamed protein product [Brassica oleracea var. botrytis]